MKPEIRIAVTGGRGKSGVTRLIHAGLAACGLRVRSRITGVLPRELSRDGERVIMRSGAASAYEAGWWFRRLPQDTQAVVCENSAVTPALQGLLPAFITPSVTVLTNTALDHTELWGADETSVLRALSEALPRGGKVVLPEALAVRFDMRLLAEERALSLFPVAPDPSLPHPFSINIALALAACFLSGADEAAARAAMESLPPDIADSCIIETGGAQLAFAFSINDLQSTESYFTQLGWEVRDTVCLYNHRADRSARFDAFYPWMKTAAWREVQIIGDKPPRLRDKYVPLCDTAAFEALVIKNKKSFGCGNTVYGLPLEFKLETEAGKKMRGIDGR